MSLATGITALAQAIGAKFKSFMSVYDAGDKSGVVAVNYANGSVQQLNATAEITALSFSGWPTSGNRGQLVLYVSMSSDLPVTFTGVTSWATGSAPTLVTGLNELVFTTIDGGTKVIGHAIVLGA